MRATIWLRCVIVVVLWAAAPAVAADAKSDAGADPTLSAMRSVIEHYTADRTALDRRYALRASPERAERLRRFYDDERAALDRVDFDSLDQGGRIDYLLLKTQLHHAPAEIQRSQKQLEEIRPLLPFADRIIALEEARQRGDRPDGEQAARALTEIESSVAQIRKDLGDRQKSGTKPPTAVLAERAAETTDLLSRALRDWDDFSAGYDPLFTWWTRDTYPRADKALRDYADFLRQRFAGYAQGIRTRSSATRSAARRCSMRSRPSSSPTRPRS